MHEQSEIRTHIKARRPPWTDPEGSGRLRTPDLKKIDPTHRPPLSLENIPGIHFC